MDRNIFVERKIKRDSNLFFGVLENFRDYARCFMKIEYENFGWGKKIVAMISLLLKL